MSVVTPSRRSNGVHPALHSTPVVVRHKRLCAELAAAYVRMRTDGGWGGIVPEELSVWMRDVADGAEVVITGPVISESSWRLWRALEAACAMYAEVTVNLAHAAPIDPTILASLLAMRDELAACDRALTLSGLAPIDQEPSHAPASGRRTRVPEPRSPRSARSLSMPGSESPEVGQMSARLCERFPFLPEDLVKDAVRHSYRTYQAARVRDFVPLLVEREVGDDLGNLGA